MKKLVVACVVLVSVCGMSHAQSPADYRAQTEKANKAPKGKPGARIGMTPEEVVSITNWGKPNKINRTITANGTREQWVYRPAGYLYFTNGVLTSIQN